MISKDSVYTRLKRILDLLAAIIGLVVLIVPMIIIAIAIKLASKGPIIFWSDRVGKFNRLFRMPKFRTMRVDTPHVATHLLVNPNTYRTTIGLFLRKSSLDELPQLFSIIVGEMSFVGPRPALFNQEDLIQLRTQNGLHAIVPGLTGWAQVNGRDELPILEKVKLDCEYMQKQSFYLDAKIIWMTFKKVIVREGVSH
jgi:O-antigen biosynthesis protein WbqP